MTKPISDVYYVKQGTDSYQDFTTKWVGLTILKMDGFNKKGKAKNIYTRSWINSANDDVYVPDVVYFENPDMSISFMVNDFDNHSVNVEAVHDSFIDYMTTHKVMIKTLFLDKEATFICNAEYEPTTIALKRSVGNNYILGTLTMHRVTTTTSV